jgi:hypothetical protein
LNKVLPFQIPDSFCRLDSHYPCADDVRASLQDAEREYRVWFLRLWVTEGIPFAFQKAPAVYEAIREWLGKRIDVSPKEITLVGSARIGYCLAAGQDYGREFNDKSDLDFTAVSEGLFGRMSEAFARWKDDVNAGRIQPTGSGQKKYWPENLKRLPENIRRGFVDPYKVPSRYHDVNQTMWVLRRKLDATTGSPGERKASLRVYRDWGCLLCQMEINLLKALGAC